MIGPVRNPCNSFQPPWQSTPFPTSDGISRPLVSRIVFKSGRFSHRSLDLTACGTWVLASGMTLLMIESPSYAEQLPQRIHIQILHYHLRSSLFITESTERPLLIRTCCLQVHLTLIMPGPWNASTERKLLLCIIDPKAKHKWDIVSEQMGSEFSVEACRYVRSFRWSLFPS